MLAIIKARIGNGVCFELQRASTRHLRQFPAQAVSIMGVGNGDRIGMIFSEMF